MLEELNVKISSDFSGLDEGIKQSQKNVEQFANNIESIGSEAFTPMEESMNNIGQSVNIVATDLGGLGESFNQVSTKTTSFSGSLKQIGSDFDALKAKYAEQQEGLTRLGEGMANVGGKMSMFLTLPILAAGAASFKLASDYEESLNKVNVVFGNNAEQIKTWAATSLESMGIASQTALDTAGYFGNMATSMGISQDKATDLAVNMTQLGVDLSSLQNVPIEQAMNALGGIFTGETESLKMLGVVMTEAELQAFALSKGIEKNVGDMTQAEKIQLRYAFVMQATTNAQGDQANTSQSAANTMKSFGESMKQLGVVFGQIILPYVTEMIQKVNGLIQGFANLPTGVKKIIIALAAFLAVLGPILLVTGKILVALPMLKAGFMMVLPAIKLLGTALKGLAMNPMGLIILAIGAVIAAAIYMWKNWDTVKIQLMMIVNAISYGFNQGLSYLKTIIFKYVDMYLAAFQKLLGWIPGLGDKIDQAREKMSSLINEEKLKRETNTFNFQTTQAGLSADLAAQKMEEAKKKTGELGDEIANTTDKTFEYNDGLDDLNKIKDDTNKTTDESKDKEKDYNKTVGDTKKGLNELTDAQKAAEEARRGMYDNTEKGLNKLGDALIKALKKRYDEEEKIVLEGIESKKKNEIEGLKESLKNLKTNYDKQVKALREKTKEEIKLLTDTQKNKLAIIDAETIDQVNALQRQIDAINNLTDQEEKQLEEQSYNTRIAELQKEIATADSAEERERAQQKLNEEIAKRQRELLLEERKNQIESLKMQIENIKDNAEQRKDEIEKQTEAEITAIETRLESELEAQETSYEQQKTGLELKLQEVEKFYEDYIATTKENYAKLTSEDALFEEARLLALAENQDEMLKLLEKYNPKWQDAGQSFGNSLLEGLNSTKQNIKTAIKEIFDLMNFMENERQYLRGLVEKGTKDKNPGLVKWAQEQAKILGIPKLAKGGVVKMPTLAMIGEKGPEAVIPLNRLNDFNGNKPINVYLDGRKITGTIAPQMVDMIRGRIGSAY